MNWLILPLIWAFFEQEYLAGPVPLKLSGHTKRLTPYIQHWEAANYDRAILDVAHKTHIEQKHHRWKRSMNAGEYGPAHVIKLNFFAHDKEFKVVLKQDPLSVFATDVEFENTHGPIEYDITRIYTGSLEDDEDSLVHAVLTNDNLLDGTIETSTDYYYVEPMQRYSQELHDSGVHSIIYKVNDVDMKKHKSSSLKSEHCASERLRLKQAFQNLNEAEEILIKNKIQNKTNQKLKHLRSKRWLPDEYNERTDNERASRDPPLPLDLDVPYNDDLHVFSTINEKTVENNNNNNNNNNKNEKTKTTKTAQDNEYGAAGFNPYWPTASSTKNRTPFRRGGDNNNNSNNNNNNKNNAKTTNRSYERNSNTEQKFYTKHKNIIVSTYDGGSGSSSNLNRSNFFDRHDDFADFNRINGNSGRNINFTNSNNNNSNSNNNSDRPSHKTHVEIITKNGATRKPYIIVNNYNPPVDQSTSNTQYPQFNSMLMTSLLSNKGPNDFGGSSSDSMNARTNYNRKITCMLYLQADHTFFQKMGSDEASIEAITRHVQRANSIYKNTDFNNDGKPDNITFMIKRIKVHNMNALNDPSYRFPGNYGVEKFLELFSEEDYDAFCLAYMFTYRDFEMGTLGLAWTGDLKNAGGVCEKNGHYRGSLKSLNTGIVTLLNYGKHVPPAVSHVTLAHEIGHNFGSPHDPEQCTPGGEDGNFIMFARATSGDKKNNNKFSPCSLKSIEPVLNSKARSPKGCFTEPQTSICGNGVVEPGEECDCGWEEDCKDACCFPMSRHPRMDERPCTLTPGSLCSQSQGPCCTNDCRLKFGDKCRDDNGCRDPSFCDGRMPQCPPSVNKPNKTICNKEFVCFMGECTGSICLAYGLESCQCIPGENDDKIKSCELCCKLPGEDKPCRSSFEWNEAPYDVPNMYAKPGTPCNDYNGYCDVFQKCREVDPSGPLATLRKLLLSEESIATFKNWMQNNWYSVVLGSIVIVVLLILSTKLLAKRSKLKLKTVTIIHSATTETVRLPADNKGVIVHRAVRTKVPFKKKVRGKRVAGKKKAENSKTNAKETKDRAKDAANELGKKRAQQAQAQQQQLPTQPYQQHKKSNSAGGVAAANVNVGNLGLEANDVGIAVGAALAGATAAATASNQLPTNATKTSNEAKPSKKTYNKKHKKEIIDYSKRGSGAAHHATGKRASLTGVIGNGTGTATNHTNTFHKVQKWLLESPIVAQPLSHIDHSSKVRKVMSKSQSTPERLLHKSPQKTKSMNNVTAPNDKVRMQVVYKPFKFSPFKFSLRFSKNAKVRTHVLGGGGKQTASGGNANQAFKAANARLKRSSAEPAVTQAGGSTQPRTAFLLQQPDEDNQFLTAAAAAASNEPTYETLQPPLESKHFEPEHIYEIAPIEMPPPPSAGHQLSRSSSKATQRASKNASESKRNSFALDGNERSMGHAMQKSRDISGSTTSINNKFGSTQNLIKSKDANFSNSSKHRHSVNSRTNKSRDVAANFNRQQSLDTAIEQHAVMLRQQQQQLTPTVLGAVGKLPPPIAAQRRSSSHLPRASIASGSFKAAANAANELPPPPPPPAYHHNQQQQQPQQPPPIAARTNLNLPLSKTPSSTSTTSTTNSASTTLSSTASTATDRSHQRSNSLRQQPHNFLPPPLPRNSVPNADDEKLASLPPVDMDQSISDVEYLVS